MSLCACAKARDLLLVALKCLIAAVLVDVRLPYWTSNVEHLVAFAAFVSKILLRMHRNGYLGTSVKVSATFYVDFCIFFRFILLTAPSLKLIWPSTAELLRFCCWYVAWRWDLNFWPFDLDQLSHMAGHVFNTAKKLEDPMPLRSWVMGSNVFYWLLSKMHFRLLRMRRITWPVCWRGVNFANNFRITNTPICLFTIQLLWGCDDD